MTIVLVLLEPDEIENIRLPSSDTLALASFVDIAQIDLARFEWPYFVLRKERTPKKSTR